MFNPCYDYCYLRYGRQYSPECESKCAFAIIAKERRLLLEQLNRKIETLYDVAIQICTATECRNCPVYYEPFETRTQFEKESLNAPCTDNLYRWMLERGDEI